MLFILVQENQLLKSSGSCPQVSGQCYIQPLHLSLFTKNESKPLSKLTQWRMAAHSVEIVEIYSQPFFAKIMRKQRDYVNNEIFM